MLSRLSARSVAGSRSALQRAARGSTVTSTQRLANWANLTQTTTHATSAHAATAVAARSFAAAAAAATPRARSDKIYATAEEALQAAGLKDGQTLVVGGFGICGIAQACVEAIIKAGTKRLTIVSNNCGVDDWGLGLLLRSKQIKRMVASYVGGNSEFERDYIIGELEVELVPQGTLAEKLRCGGAGIPAFYTRTAFGTVVANGGLPIKWGPNKTVEIMSEPKEIKVFNGREYVMEESIVGDIALVKAWKADTYGNLVFRGTARNFNPDCATASRFCIAEVEEIVPMGEIDPKDVHVSGVFVKAIVKAQREKKIEKLKLTAAKGTTKVDSTPAGQLRERLARRAALELKDGMNVNLGIGIPTMAANYLTPGATIMLQSENGLLGIGPYPTVDQVDPDLVNAGKETVTALPGSSFFSSSTSFGMIRGKHIDVSILGAMEVSQYGDLANWIIPGKMVKGMGGAMDLVSSGARVVVTMEHTAKGGKPKILNSCRLPLTGTKCVNIIITEMGVFDVDPVKGLTLIEIAPDTTLEAIKKATEAPFAVAANLKTMPV